MKYKAKALISKEELDQLNIPNKDGWVIGYYADGYILGDVVEATDEYINFEWWIKVNKTTIQEE